jgi:SAM-dependent methyltransferase
MNFDEQYFHSIYRNYREQNPPRKLRFYRRLLEPHIRSASPRILDLGCAFGFFLEALNGDYHKFGMDISLHAISTAIKRVPDAHLVVADCAMPPFLSQFDGIVAFDVLEHVPDLDSAAEFVRHSLAPGGVFLFVVPVYDGMLGPVVEWLDKDPTHVHKRSRYSWLKWASRNFEVIGWTGMLRYLLAPGCYIHTSANAIRRFAPAIAVVAKLKTSG